MTVPSPRTATLYALIAANVITALGVMFLGWDMRDTVLLFWLENLIIGFYALLRIIFVPGDHLSKPLAIPFFCFHFGMFTFVHGVFVNFLTFGPDGFNKAFSLLGMPGLAFRRVPLAAAALFISHGYSFVVNYLLLGERRQTTVKQEMERPYSRVIIMHFTILAAFFLMAPLGGAQDDFGSALRIVPTLTLIAIKTLVDAWTHLRSHRGPDASETLAQPSVAA